MTALRLLVLTASPVLWLAPAQTCSAYNAAQRFAPPAVRMSLRDPADPVAPAARAPLKVGTGAPMGATFGHPSNPAPMNVSPMNSSPMTASNGAPLTTWQRAPPSPRSMSDGMKAPTAADFANPIHSGSLRTWSYQNPMVQFQQVVLATEGGPLDADIELWHGPDNIPCKMRVHIDDAQYRPFSAVIATPKGPNTVAVTNKGAESFPIAGNVLAENVDMPSDECVDGLVIAQGGSIRVYHAGHACESVEVLIKTDGRPLNARIELLQGPNCIKQVVQLYTEDGFLRPFFGIIETPGDINTVRIVNTSPIEFPMSSSCVPHHR